MRVFTFDVMYVSLVRADMVGVLPDHQLVFARRDLLGGLREVAEAGPDALIRNFAGQQDDAVVARDVEVDPVAVLRVGLLRRSLSSMPSSSTCVPVGPAIAGDQRGAVPRRPR
jgi:hypothetical protein